MGGGCQIEGRKGIGKGCRERKDGEIESPHLEILTLALSAPEWFVLPVLWKTHGGHVNRRVFIKQRLEPCNKSIVRIDCLQEIQDYRQDIIDFLRVTWYRDKWQPCSTRDNCVDAEPPIP